MTPLSKERWERIEALLEEALDLDSEARDAFLERACAGDADLRRDVERLLHADSDAPPFLEAGAANFALPMLPEGAKDAEEPPTAERTGQRFGAWQVVEELGRGGMGVVYRAERADDQFEQTVALKLIKRGMDTDAILDRFLNERSVLASLDHPHIARLFDGGVTEEGTPWFAMEHVEGRPITDYCNENGLSLDERLALFTKVCRAVRHAHNRLIVHRDLKPSNILVTRRGEPRLLDFGLAKVLRADGSENTATRPGRRWITLDYASPEQVQGKALTTASDTYQLGLILYELITGTRPYTVEGLSPTEAERVICEIDPPKPSTSIVLDDGTHEVDRVASTSRSTQSRPDRLRRRLKGDLDTIILKTLRKDPEQRYDSAETLATDIEHFQKGLPIDARPDTLAYRARKFVRRNRVGVAAAATIVLSLVGGLGAALWQAREAQTERDQAHETTEFMAGLFEAMDPDAYGGRIQTVRDIIDLGAERVEQSFAENPEVRASMLVRLGRLYEYIDEDEAALPLLERGRELAEEQDDALLQAGALRAAGMAQLDLGKHDEGKESFGWAVRVLHANGEAPGAQHGDLLALYARRLWESEERGEALERTRNWANRARSDPALSPAALYEYLEGYGIILLWADSLDRAESIFRSALALPVSTENASEVQWRARSYLAQVAWLRGDARAALALQRALLEQVEEPFPQFHSRRVYVQEQTVHSLVRLGRRDEAVDLARKVVESWRTLNPHPTNQEYVLNLERLASLLRKTGRDSEAIAYLEEAMSIFREQFGQDNGRFLSMASSLGDSFRRLGRTKESEELFALAVKGARSLRTNPEYALSTALGRLAELRMAQGATSEARSLLDEALSLQGPSWNAGNDYFRKSQQELLQQKARMLAQLGQTDEAKLAYEQAIRIGDQLCSFRNCEWPRILAGYARFLTDQNDPEAGGAAARALEASRDIYGDDHTHTREMERLVARHSGRSE